MTDENDKRIDADKALPFSHKIAPGLLSRAKATALDIRPESAELPRIAAYLGIADVTRLRFKGFLRPRAEHAWEAEGRLTAQITQDCVVTLDPVHQKIDAQINRFYLPEHELLAELPADFGLDDDDEPEGFTREIELSGLIIESLALLLDPYPRAKDAELPEGTYVSDESTPDEDDIVKPFAKLAALKETLQNKKS